MTEDFPLSTSQVRKVAGIPVPVMSYQDITKYKNIDQLLSNPYKSVVILYEYEPNVGHWTCIFMNHEGYNFFDSYGYAPDDEFSFIPKKIREQLGEGRRHLSELLINSNPHVDIHYNDYILQGKDSNTCGRYVGYRLRNKKKSIEEFVTAFENSPLKPDELIIKLTSKYVRT